MKYLMFYELAPDGLSKVQAHFAAHQERLQAFHRDGRLLMAGPYGSPPVGALGIFTSRESAEDFLAGDPFVLHGIVGQHNIQEWSEALAP